MKLFLCIASFLGLAVTLIAHVAVLWGADVDIQHPAFSVLMIAMFGVYGRMCFEAAALSDTDDGISLSRLSALLPRWVIVVGGLLLMYILLGSVSETNTSNFSSASGLTRVLLIFWYLPAAFFGFVRSPGGADEND